jgi:hypothetical protein
MSIRIGTTALNVVNNFEYEIIKYDKKETALTPNMPISLPTMFAA